MTKYDDARAALDAAEAEHEVALGRLEAETERANAAETRASQAETKYEDHMGEFAPAGHPTKPTTPTDPQPPTPQPKKFLLGTSLRAPIPIEPPRLDILRAYYQPGEFARGRQQDFTAHDAYKYGWQRGVRDYLVSVKDYDEGALEAFAETVPTGARIWFTYFHEMSGNIREGSLSLAKYHEGMGVCGEFARDRGWEFGPIHNGSNRQNGQTGPWGFWIPEWKKNEAPNVDDFTFWGVDGYCEKYEDPAVRYDPAFEYAESLGLPIVWGEIGAPKGTQQTGWMLKARALMEANARACCYWNGRVDASKPDWGLTVESSKVWFTDKAA